MRNQISFFWFFKALLSYYYIVFQAFWLFSHFLYYFRVGILISLLLIIIDDILMHTTNTVVTRFSIWFSLELNWYHMLPLFSYRYYILLRRRYKQKQLCLPEPLPRIWITTFLVTIKKTYRCQFVTKTLK